MSDLKLEKCVCGSAVKVREGLIGHWAGCVSGGCWYGPECKTPKKAAEAWNTVMRAARAASFSVKAVHDMSLGAFVVEMGRTYADKARADIIDELICAQLNWADALRERDELRAKVVELESDFAAFRARDSSMGREHDIKVLQNRIAELERERDAYKKAKAENDARYMLERDEARNERDASLEKCRQWEEKAKVWLASPEAAARLDGYRELGARASAAENERDQARAELAATKARLDEAREALRDIDAGGDRCFCDQNYPGGCGCGRAMQNIALDALERIDATKNCKPADCPDCKAEPCEETKT